MRYVSLGEVVGLQRAILDQTAGALGIRDIGGLESALGATTRHVRRRRPASNGHHE